MAAIKLARTDDEIAFLIGHEIAHNIKHFKKFNSNEANSLAINYLDMPKVRELGDLFIWTNEEKEIEADIEGALNAGLNAIHFIAHGERIHNKCKIIHDLDELIGIL